MVDTNIPFKNDFIEMGHDVDFGYFSSGHDYWYWGETFAEGLIYLIGNKLNWLYMEVGNNSSNYNIICIIYCSYVIRMELKNCSKYFGLPHIKLNGAVLFVTSVTYLNVNAYYN